MKKNEIKILVISLIIFIFCGTSACKPIENKENKKDDTAKNYVNYKTYVGAESNSGIGNLSEIDLWNQEYFYNKNAPKTMSFQIQERQIEGIYRDSIIEATNSYITDNYESEDGFIFGVRSDTGGIVLVNLMNKEFFEDEPFLEDLENPNVVLKQLATEIANEYVENLDEYQEYSQEPKSEDRVKYYFYTFYKNVAGYRSTDYITVKVTSKGNLASVKVGDTGAFNGKQIEIDRDEVSKSIDLKLKELYKDYTIIEHSTQDQKITKSPEDKFYIMTREELRVKEQSDRVIKVGVILLTEV